MTAPDEHAAIQRLMSQLMIDEGVEKISDEVELAKAEPKVSFDFFHGKRFLRCKMYLPELRVKLDEMTSCPEQDKARVAKEILLRERCAKLIVLLRHGRIHPPTPPPTEELDA